MVRNTTQVRLFACPTVAVHLQDEQPVEAVTCAIHTGIITSHVKSASLTLILSFCCVQLLPLLGTRPIRLAAV